MREIYTIGHSTHSIQEFVELLRRHLITAVCDVRSSPYSRFNPQFNREALKQELRKQDIAYVFLGKELGARSDDPKCYQDGKVQYERLAKTALFKQGIHRLHEGMKSYKIALMCAEKDPITCHRTILVCRQLRSSDLAIKHILWNGRIETHQQAEHRLLNLLGIPKQDLYSNTEDLIEEAYEIQAERIAYTINTTDNNYDFETAGA